MIKTLQISHDPPNNLYMVSLTSGLRQGISFKSIDFMVPVLGFTQPRVHSETNQDWYAVIHRTKLEQDIFGHYYKDDDGIMYELVMLTVPWSGKYEFNENSKLAFIDGSNYDCFLETLEHYYNKCRDIHEELKVLNEYVEYNTIKDFLIQYETFIKEKYPRMLI